uniref:Uncharacterized protein n=1 Tax=Physcomitrium patens TaxID=3218 RepID=A0A7I4ENJ0_PHYPA
MVPQSCCSHDLEAIAAKRSAVLDSAP